MMLMKKKFLKYFTEISTDELEEIIKDEKDINNLKILLANEATKILHGQEKANDSEKTAQETFKGGGIGQNLPVILINKSLIEKGISSIELLYESKILNSKSEVRRAINEKGIKINDILI